MAFGSPFIGALLGGYANAVFSKQRSPDQIQVIKRKIPCDYCGRRGASDQCQSCGAPMDPDPVIIFNDPQKDMDALINLRMMPNENNLGHHYQIGQPFYLKEI